MSKDKQLTLFDNTSIIEKSNGLSLANTDSKLTLTQMQLLSIAILSREENQTFSEFYLKEFEKYADISKYHKSRALKDIVALRKVGFTFMDSDFLEGDDVKGRMVTYNLIESINYDNGVFQVNWIQRAQPLLQDMQKKYMQIDLEITRGFTSQYSWILYEILKANYQKSKVKVITKEIDDLKNDFKVQDIASYKKNFANFRRKVLDVAVDEINRFTELHVAYTPIYSGKSVKAITFEWRATRVDYLATQSQMDELNRLAKELEQYVSFKNKKEYDDIRQILMEADFSSFTKNVAKSIIKRATKIQKDLAREESRDDLLLSEGKRLLRFNEELKQDLIPLVSRNIQQDYQFSTDQKDAAMFLFFDHAFNNASKNMIHAYSKKSVVKYIAQFIVGQFQNKSNTEETPLPSQIPSDDLKLLFKDFERELGRDLSPFETEDLQKTVENDKVSPELVREALKEAVLNGKVNLKYINAIIRNWREDGIQTVQQIEQSRLEREQSQPQNVSLSDEFKNAMNLWSKES